MRVRAPRGKEQADPIAKDDGTKALRAEREQERPGPCVQTRFEPRYESRVYLAQVARREQLTASEMIQLLEERSAGDVMSGDVLSKVVSGNDECIHAHSAVHVRRCEWERRGRRLMLLMRMAHVAAAMIA